MLQWSLRSMLHCAKPGAILRLHLNLAGVVQGGDPSPGPGGFRLGGSGSAQGGGSVVGRPRGPPVGVTVGWEPAGPYWPQPGLPHWSVHIYIFICLYTIRSGVRWWKMCYDMTFVSLHLDCL